MTKAKRRHGAKKIFLEVSAGVCDVDTYQEGFSMEITPEQLIECREIIGLEYVTKILSMYYERKNEKKPVSPATTTQEHL